MNLTQVDIKSKEYKLITGQSHILNRGGQTGMHRPGIFTCLVNQEGTAECAERARTMYQKSDVNKENREKVKEILK